MEFAADEVRRRLQANFMTMASAPFRSQFTRSAQNAAETATGPPAQAMLSQCGLLPSQPAGSVVLDNACGGGIVTARLMEGGGSHNHDMRVICGDLDQTMVEITAQRIKENAWNAEAQVIDAQAVPYGDAYFSHVLMNFGPQLMPDPIKALKETHRILREGGPVGFTCWIKPGWISSVQEVLPSFQGPPSLSGPWSDPEAVKTRLTALGFSDIEATKLDFTTNEQNVDNYLELMQLLLGKVLVGDTADAYGKLTRKKHECGEMGMDWQALIVSAVKTSSTSSA